MEVVYLLGKSSCSTILSSISVLQTSTQVVLVFLGPRFLHFNMRKAFDHNHAYGCL